jgi:hypothetical protein
LLSAQDVFALGRGAVFGDPPFCLRDPALLAASPATPPAAPARALAKSKAAGEPIVAGEVDGVASGEGEEPPGCVFVRKEGIVAGGGGPGGRGGVR